MASVVAQAATTGAAASPAAGCRRTRATAAAPFCFAGSQAARRGCQQAWRRQLQPVRASSEEQPEQQQAPEQGRLVADAGVGAGGEQYVQLGPRDDDVLPDSLTDALEDSSRATVEALERGVDRCVVRPAGSAFMGFASGTWTSPLELPPSPSCLSTCLPTPPLVCARWRSCCPSCGTRSAAPCMPRRATSSGSGS